MNNFKLIFTFFTFLFLIKISSAQPLQFINAFPNASFSNPLFLTHSNDGTNRIFIAEKNGIVKVLPNDSSTSNVKIFLNMTNLIITGSERGLLGLAFHPDYANNGYFYVNYTRASDGATKVSRFTRSASDPDKADSLSEFNIITISQPFSNHNGGIIFFGIDGYLYVGMGDGGSGNDPGNRAQNVNELLGKILRIDVNTSTGGNNYGIPSTNPFAGGGGRPEIFTVGMRNPWRMSQDPVTGIIYCGDVGQDAWEEIDIIEVGKNYGWRCYEGNHPTINVSSCTQPMASYTFPIKEYANAGSDISITGGYVYRGIRRPELTGRYIYSDYGSRKTWKLKYEGGIVTEDEFLFNAPSNVYSYGTDQRGELYLCGANSIIYRFNKSDLVAVNGNGSNVPEGFTLEQNYPNPFNPSTSIKYSIPELSKVKLSIFDVTGKTINTLVNTAQLAGEYNISWNGKDGFGNSVPSGAYFYSLTSDKGFSETKRMVLVK
ncbi:MAG: PQQ-dependent sugar dehydrogenase [Ignavibacteria bacterium]